MIILASQSPARQALLRRAGVPFTCVAPSFDEAAAKACFTSADPASLALYLATGKAGAVSALYPEANVIGADQTLVCEGRFYDKPWDRTAARDQLKNLRGRTHVLTSSVCCMSAGKSLWSHTEEASITFADFSDEFLAHYLDEAGDAILSSVGAYHYEGIGLRLMTNVSGSDHVILGLPVLPLVAFLRSEGLVAR